METTWVLISMIFGKEFVWNLNGSLDFWMESFVLWALVGISMGSKPRVWYGCMILVRNFVWILV